MKKIVTFFYISGLLFGAFGFIHSVVYYTLSNGFGETFTFEEAKLSNLLIDRDSSDVDIQYQYSVNNIEYRDRCLISSELYDRRNLNSILVKYNHYFPNISYIEGVKIKLIKQKTGMVLSLIFLLFLISVWTFSDRDKWISIYEGGVNKPLFYPDNKSIKNPWKRLMNMCFKK
jgi:hypothetical protein